MRSLLAAWLVIVAASAQAQDIRPRGQDWSERDVGQGDWFDRGRGGSSLDEWNPPPREWEQRRDYIRPRPREEIPLRNQDWSEREEGQGNRFDLETSPVPADEWNLPADELWEPEEQP